MLNIDAVGQVTIVELDRQERRNALTGPLCDGIAEAVAGAHEAGQRAIVITGAGTAFCAGADLTGVGGESFESSLYGAFDAILAAPIPVIAAINGPAVGAGTQLALACDLRVVGPGGFFALPTVRLGLAVNPWTIRRLRGAIGRSRAAGMLLGAERIDAADALSYGLANRLGGLDDAVAWATEMTHFAPLTLRFNKLALNDDREVATAEIDAAYEACWASADLKEALLARTEKRPPLFEGR